MRPERFAQRLIDEGVLLFGEFELKSGRRSPYFFNLGAIDDGAALEWLGAAYADLAMRLPTPPDVVFGPAYKGIPIAVATAIALHRSHGRRLGVAFDRKEAKAHGEGGQLVGCPLAGRKVAIVDDIVTDGGAKRTAADAIAQAGGELVGILIALDRQELLADGYTATQALETGLGAPVRSVVTLEHVVRCLEEAGGDAPHLAAMRDYRRRHCAPA